MRINKWLAAALAACLCAGAWCPPALAEEGGEAEPPVPKIVVSGTRVSGGKTFELGLRVRQKGLKSVSATLAFDADKLVPAGWDAEAAPVDLTGATSWATAKELPTKLAADGMFYKPARAWLDAEGKTGYLYLGAAYDTPADVDGLTTLVRFAYAEGVKPEELKLDGGADSAVRLAPDEAALANTLFPQKLGYTVRGAAEGQLTQYVYDPIRANADGAPDADADYAFCIPAQDVGFSLTDGSSNVGGGGSADGFCTVVFYDWDGTLLGSRVVAKGGSIKGETLDECGDGAEQAPKPPEGELLWDVNGNGEYDFIANNNAGNDAKNKAGYTFAGWVDYNTGHSTPNVENSATSGQKHPQEEFVSLSSIDSDLVVMAAYDENEMIASNANLRRYLISYTPFIKNGGAVDTEITVRRPQNARRALDGMQSVKIALQPKGRGQTTVVIPLGKTDVETIVFSMPIGADQTYDTSRALSLTVVDGNGATISGTTYIKASEMAT